jgi:hypothetical protein
MMIGLPNTQIWRYCSIQTPGPGEIHEPDRAGYGFSQPRTSTKRGNCDKYVGIDDSGCKLPQFGRENDTLHRTAIPIDAP